jgi:DNA-binding CsgD family transcriptional regulator
MDVTGDHTAQNLRAGQPDVMKLIVRFLSNKEIASILNLAEGTIKIHVAALRKLGVHRRRAAVTAAGGRLTERSDVSPLITAKECLQGAEVCLAFAHKTKGLDTRAAFLEFAYEFRTVAKSLERDERKLIVRAASPTHGE